MSIYVFRYEMKHCLIHDNVLFFRADSFLGAWSLTQNFTKFDRIL